MGYLYTKGMEVQVDKKCRETKRTYGLNRDMRENFLGKIAIVDRDVERIDSVIKLRGRDVSTVWSFHPDDVSLKSQLNFPKKVSKPEVKETKFNPEYL